MSKDKYFIIDFDSTFTQVEALDELGAISLQNHPERERILEQVKQITDSAMAGSSSFAEGLAKRLELLQAHQSHLPLLINRLKERVSESIRRNRDFLQEYADQILIVSSGFKEFITPIVTEYGIKEENIYANTFHVDAQGNLTGFDKENLLSLDKGKIKLLEQLALPGDVYVLGDGYTD